MGLKNLKLSFLKIILLYIPTGPIVANTNWFRSGDYFTIDQIITTDAKNFCNRKYLVFPTIIQGCQEIYLDSHLISSNGLCDFSRVGSYYAAPTILCDHLKYGKTIRWVAKSFIDEFARPVSYKLTDQYPLRDFISGKVNIYASGALLLLTLFVLALFWQKVSTREIIFLSASSLFWGVYHTLISSGDVGLEVPMFYTHKISDLCLIFGTYFFFLVLAYEGMLNYRLVLGNSIFCAAAFFFAVMAKNGNEIQSATNIGFIPTILLSAYTALNSIYSYLKAVNTINLLKVLSIVGYVLAMSNDILNTLGAIETNYIFWLGSLSAILLLVLLLNEKIKIIYHERDDLLKNLESKIVERTEHIKLLYDDLVRKEKFVSLGNIAGSLAHELNTPIGVCLKAQEMIFDYSEDMVKLLNNHDLDKSSISAKLEKNKKYCLTMRSSLEQASKLITSFKSVSTDVELGERRKINTIKYLEDTSLTLINLNNEKKIELQINDAIKGSVYTYPGELTQIITNLYNNSIVHGFKDKNEGIIKITFKKSNHLLNIEYEDNGSGIEQSKITKIFEPFFTTKKYEGGTGLGLSIVYNIITELMKGTIVAESEIGKYAKFKITVPCEDANE